MPTAAAARQLPVCVLHLLRTFTKAVLARISRPPPPGARDSASDYTYSNSLRVTVVLFFMARAVLGLTFHTV